ncbi:MAG: HNH endonuclease [Hyphomonadaceae bacterium]
MNHGPTHTESKGVCIYCGARGVPLSDEHIVPYAIGGSHVIRKASCRACAKITGAFEQKVLRDLWGDARASFNAPTRRKKERRSHITMPDAGAGSLTLPVAEHPGGFVFYAMCKAGLLQGFSNEVDLSAGWRLVVVDDDKRRQNFLAKYPDRLTMRFRHVPKDFARMIAKIGYGHIMTALDPGDFNPICVPYILGKADNVSFVVGGTAQAQGQTQEGYQLQSAVFGGGARVLLIALVRLLANTSAPAYHVVVGDVAGADRVLHALTKLGVDSGQLPALANQNDHWVPDVKPLPYWLK